MEPEGFTTDGPLGHPHVLLVPRKTIFCLEHFYKLVKHVREKLATEPSKALSEILPIFPSRPEKIASKTSAKTKQKLTAPAPAAPTRIQPRRAAKKTVVERTLSSRSARTSRVVKRQRHSASVLSSSWVLGGVRIADLSQIVIPDKLPWDVYMYMSKVTDWIRFERDGGVECPFGAAPWTCVACKELSLGKNMGFAIDLVGNSYDMDEHEEKYEPAPMAPMLPGCCGSTTCWPDTSQVMKWESVRVPESRILKVGPLVFAVDMCDEDAVKVMFLEASL